jgi:tetratricopeptide (TPR) repeat protein
MEEPRDPMTRESSRQPTGRSRSRPTPCGRITSKASTFTIRTARTRRSPRPTRGWRSPLWGVRGNANLFDGRFEQAKSDILQATKLSPHDPLMFYSRKYLGDAELGLGQFDAAVDDYHRAIDLGMHDMWPYTSLAAANALAGKMDEAKTALAEARRLNPKVTIKFVTQLGPPIPNLFDGLRKAGLPEE